MTLTSSLVEAFTEPLETLVGAARHTRSAYERIFQRERAIRTLDLLAFSAIHVIAMVPLALTIIDASITNHWLKAALGVCWALIGYQFAYPESAPSGLLNISVKDYLASRGAALLASWLLLIALPLMLLWQARYFVLVLLAGRLLYALTAT